MDLPVIQKTVATGRAKALYQEERLGAYMLRSVLAGLYLGLICFLFWNLVHNLGTSPFGKVVASLFFGVGLFVIIVTGSELFTSNAMYMTTSTFARRTSWKQTARLWTCCWLGNLIGSFLIAGLLAGAGILDALPVDHALYIGAEHKIHQSAQAIFFKGILANWVVCLAVWVSLHLKEDIARLASTMLIVSIFLYLGFEHSIANMGTFAEALLGKGSLDVVGALANLFWSTLGNIVGGGALIGGAYWALDRRTAAETAE